jgi:hypothetical protein
MTREMHNDLVYRCANQHSEPCGDQRKVNNRAGNRCGMGVRLMRNAVRASKPCQTGICKHSPHLELTRFSGHLIVTKQGVQEAQIEESQAALSSCISPTNCRARCRRQAA